MGAVSSDEGCGAPPPPGYLPQDHSLGNGEEVLGCVHLDLHVVALQLHQASADLHLLPESFQKLLSEQVHLRL